MGKTSAKPPETQEPAEHPVPPLLMCTVRPDKMAIGPTLAESLVQFKTEGTSPEALDATLKTKGYVRRWDWHRDGLGPWTLVAKASDVEPDEAEADAGDE